MSKVRCEWAQSHELHHDYHDKEWGVPVHDDRKLFEMLNLEGAQAGLSWLTILKRRDDYNLIFENFDPQKLVKYTDEQLDAILLDARIIRNRLKVYSVRSNAEAYLKVVEEFGSFDAYIWQFVGGKPIINTFKSMKEVPVSTPESDAMSKDLKKRSFKFCGTTICYAYMQAVGMVNDHTMDCFRYNEVQI
ncbi:DNA-3-methyladenine glycosylase I [Fusibacter ferrireducens]|uniref:DNA-3-methyladenine glycosylase I n=1 Tax=Fusibacter ferrireducens TaxID=2785058 RepID=A0ABR9ZMX2_9FIRM|nr:DNA-3-methyladenine glycosylase I [Fusibacter ferrireducens]MBF4691827.1 DNA-3-methyladenine glycosylase I [Fusibacter ferrireducens]